MPAPPPPPRRARKAHLRPLKYFGLSLCPLQVDEELTIAAAATFVMGMCGGPAPPRPRTFRADHPFLYAIVDATKAILFVGTYRG